MARITYELSEPLGIVSRTQWAARCIGKCFVQAGGTHATEEVILDMSVRDLLTLCLQNNIRVTISHETSEEAEE